MTPGDDYEESLSMRPKCLLIPDETAAATDAKPETNAAVTRDPMIIGAQKIQRRKEGRVERSQWMLTFKTPEGEEVSGIYMAQSQTAPPGATPDARAKRYPETCGISAVFKTLTQEAKAEEKLDPRLPPEFGLKSYHQGYYVGLSAPFSDLKRTARYLTTFGITTHAGVHKHAPQKPFLLMAKLKGPDFFNYCAKGYDFSTTEAEYKLTKAYVRLLAKIQHFHDQEKRPFIDLKPENIMPECDAVGHIVDLPLIDVDGSVGQKFAATLLYMDPEDVMMLFLYEQNKRSPMGLPKSIDFHTLSNILGVALANLKNNAFVWGSQTVRYEIKNEKDVSQSSRFEHYVCQINPRNSRQDTDLIKLYQALKAAKESERAEHLIATAFGTGSPYLTLYGETYATYQARFNSYPKGTPPSEALAGGPQAPASTDTTDSAWKCVKWIVVSRSGLGNNVRRVPEIVTLPDPSEIRHCNLS